MAFLWGYKLANFIKKLEKLGVPEGVSGYGKVISIEGEFKGEWLMKNDENI